MFKSLEEMYQSEEFQMWDSDNRSAGGSGIILTDPDRYDRIEEGAEFGTEGSTHQEIIEDWREFLDNLDEDEADLDAITAEIDDCEKWHKENGSLEQQGA